MADLRPELLHESVNKKSFDLVTMNLLDEGGCLGSEPSSAPLYDSYQVKCPPCFSI